MFKNIFKRLFPFYDKDNDFTILASTQIASGSFVYVVTNLSVYPLIYLRTILGDNIGKDKYKMSYTPRLSSLVESTFFSNFWFIQAMYLDLGCKALVRVLK